MLNTVSHQENITKITMRCHFILASVDKNVKKSEPDDMNVKWCLAVPQTLKHRVIIRPNNSTPCIYSKELKISMQIVVYKCLSNTMTKWDLPQKCQVGLTSENQLMQYIMSIK